MNRRRDGPQTQRRGEKFLAPGGNRTTIEGEEGEDRNFASKM
jgi:hypothetical protein